MEAVTLENTSDETMHVFDAKGIRHSILPMSVAVRPQEIADLFLTTKSRYVRKYRASSIPDRPGERKMWLANVTGNPAASDTIEVQRMDRKTGLTIYEKRPNPLKAPQAVQYRMQRGQEIGIAEDGKEFWLNLSAVKVRFPSAQRFPVSESIAKWLLQRDAMQDEGNVGKIVDCRPPSDFEPNESWPYDHVRIYAGLMQVPIDLKKEFPPAMQAQGDVSELRDKLLHALFFFLINEKYTLPNKAAFDIALDAFDSWEKSERDKRAGHERAAAIATAAAQQGRKSA